MNAARRFSVLVAAMLALAACGSSAPSTSTVAPASSGGQASQAAAPSASTATATARPSPAVAAKCDKAPKKFDASHIDLTGPWAGDDEGIYYLRQEGSILWWNGMSGRAGSPSDLGRDWNNVGRGVIKALKVDVEWADVPRGGILGNGTLSLKIEDDGTGNVHIVKVDETGTGFGNNIWTPCTPG